MADLASFRQVVEILHRGTRADVDGLESLADALAREAEHLRRRDQAECIAVLRARVAQQVEDILLAENQARYGFECRRNSKAMAHMVAGGITALLSKDGDRLQTGARRAKVELANEAPFGRIVVKVEPPGIPDGVKVISMSRLARENRRSESEIKTRLEAGGDCLMTPESFLVALDELREDVLEGKVCLPVTTQRLLIK